jgi:autotransporter translocation and assembly factor TamB
VYQNGNVVLTKNFKRAVPAEMMHIKIAADKLQQQGNLEVNME